MYMAIVRMLSTMRMKQIVYKAVVVWLITGSNAVTSSRFLAPLNSQEILWPSTSPKEFLHFATHLGQPRVVPVGDYIEHTAHGSSSCVLL